MLDYLFAAADSTLALSFIASAALFTLRHRFLIGLDLQEMLVLGCYDDDDLCHLLDFCQLLAFLRSCVDDVTVLTLIMFLHLILHLLVYFVVVKVGQNGFTETKFHHGLDIDREFGSIWVSDRPN